MRDKKQREAASANLPRWYFTPLVVMVIGVISASLMVWANHIREMQRNNSMRIEVLMDVQISAAEFHLWVEQIISGDGSLDQRKVMANMDGAITLIDSLIKGGETEHGWVSVPFEDPGMLGRAAEVKALLEDFRAVAVTRLQSPGQSRPGSPSDIAFDNIYKKILFDTSALESAVEKGRTRSRAEALRINQGIFVGWMIVVTSAVAGLWGREKRRRAAKQALLEANEQLAIQAVELEEHRGRLEFLVEKRTAELTAANALLQQEGAERRHALEELAESEKQVRQLSARLINAQEAERRRISAELHDELGQALNVVKLRLRVIANNLGKDPKTAGEECEELMEYLNLVIDDVRRLSLSLSPTILEDLGLTSALKWLVDNLSARSEMNVHCDIEEVDNLIPRENWIGVYRVVQEALTNACKHAGAENLSVVMHRDDDKVAVLVEDDGVGFDPGRATGKDASKKGLGLTTMSERLGMIGGIIDISSREGGGTRVAFSMPVQERRD